jgi:hypothetical protein
MRSAERVPERGASREEGSARDAKGGCEPTGELLRLRAAIVEHAQVPLAELVRRAMVELASAEPRAELNYGPAVIPNKCASRNGVAGHDPKATLAQDSSCERRRAAWILWANPRSAVQISSGTLCDESVRAFIVPHAGDPSP